MRGTNLINALVDLPLALSPVVVGLAFLLLYGRNGWFGSWLEEHGVQIVFSTPGMILVTMFVSLPFVVREVVPVLREIGTEQEQAAETLGASPLQTFRRITLPAIRWAIVYGVVLTTARALGEYGAVSVMSGRVVGKTETLTLHVEYALPELRLRRRLRFRGHARPDRDHDPRAHDRLPPERRALMAIAVRSVTKRFGDFTALDSVSLAIPGGSLTALLGPSGSGKSTLLRVMAGLEQPDEGDVLISGEEATGVPARKRGVGFVFQHYAAFKHMTVERNIAFGLDIRKRPKQETRKRVGELLELVQLQGLAKRYPSQLSGGQRQRMALARALAVDPKVLLLDEPFGALDARVRKELRAWLRRLHDEVHVTTVFVTHDQEEAMEVADRIAVMNEGRIEQVGRPRDLYEHPANEFVMTFVGPVSRLRGEFVRPHDLELTLEPNGTTERAVVAAGRPPRLRGAGRAHARGRPGAARAGDPRRGRPARPRGGADRVRAAEPHAELRRRASARERRLERARSLGPVDRDDDALERRRLEGADRVDHRAGGVGNGNAADAGAEGRERERPRAETVGRLEDCLGRASDELRRRAQVLAHHRSVDDVLRLQRAAASGDRAADRDRPLRHRLALDLRAAGPLDRAGDTGAHPQVVVGRVRDRVDLELRDVALDDLDVHGSPPSVVGL